MALFSYRKDIVRFIATFSIAIAIFNLNGCSSKPSEKKHSLTTQCSAKNEEKGNWTDTIIGSWCLRLHGPGPKGQHPVWEGPVEIGSKPDVFLCKLNLELIDSMWIDPGKGILSFSGYSGSNTYNYFVNVDSCSFITIKLPAIGSE